MRRGIRNPNPSYVWRPDQIVRRGLRQVHGRRRLTATLPWGVPIALDTAHRQEDGLARLGTHELPVTEMMWRLADPSDLALDVGANIGYYTSLLSRRVRRVTAFEPHPKIAARLRANSARWGPAEIKVEERAVSDSAGTALLQEPENFELNSGTASIEDGGGEAGGLEVETVCLDELLSGDPVGILKIDVEGHELAALRGLGESLAPGGVRDIFFEEHQEFPTAVSELLTDAGFEIFSLEQKFRGVDLGPANGPPQAWYSWAAPTFLATSDPDRARVRAGEGGWRCLRPR